MCNSRQDPDHVNVEQEELKKLQAKIENTEKRLSKLMEPGHQELTRLLQEQKIEEARSAIAKAKSRKTESKPLSGKTAVEGELKFEVQHQVFRAVKSVAKQIVDSLDSQTVKHVVILTGDKVELSTHLLHSLQDSIGGLHSDYERCLSTEGGSLRVPFPDAVSGVTLAVGAVADLVSMFRNERSIKAVTGTIESFALTAQVAHFLRRNDVEVLLPQVVPSPRSQLSINLINLRTLVVTGEKDRAGIEAKGPEANAAERLRSEALEFLEGQWALLSQRLAAAVRPGGPSLMEELIAVEQVVSFMDQEREGDVRVLLLKDLAAGGTQRQRRHRFSLIDKLAITGGATVGYMVLDAKWSLVDADIISEFEGPTGIEDLGSGAMMSAE